MNAASRAMLNVCVTCKSQGQAGADGKRLFDAVGSLIAAFPQIDLRAATCLANCSQGCGAALTASGKWSYLLGHLTPALAGDLLVYAATYALSETGTVMPSRRPASLRDIVIGRIPSVSVTPQMAQALSEQAPS